MRHDEGKTPTIHRVPPRPPGAAMATFAVQYTYTDDADRVATFRPEHRAHLAELHAEGTLLLSGPLGGDPGALLIVTAESEERSEERRVGKEGALVSTADD